MDASDIFKFLSKFGRECAGALLFSRTDTYPDFRDYKVKIDLKNFYKNNKHLLYSLSYINCNTIQPRLSIAGCQDKTPIIIDYNNDFWYPFGDMFSTHILKSDVLGFSSSTRNEIFCLDLAAKVKLPVVENFLYTVKNGSFACIKRYDRLATTRLHQVDFCQVLGLLPCKKYQEFNSNDNLIKRIVDFCLNNAVETPFGDTVPEYFAKTMVFNYLIKNRDAHCKNFSLLYKPDLDGYTLQLSPLYDLNSMHIYSSSPAMSMSYGGELQHHKIRWINFELLAKEIGIDTDNMYSILYTMANDIGEIAYDLAKKHVNLYNNAKCYNRLAERIEMAAKNPLQFLNRNSYD
ncbi:MAG: HipA domain-containing protein [Desulfovibrionaceae bacterium]|nr:HipA domain-containing protein [Desulfovibrionaceae bacterium]